MSTDTLTVTVDRMSALRLLHLAGVRADARGGWTFADGRHYWQTDEALAMALDALADADARAEADPINGALVAQARDLVARRALVELDGAAHGQAIRSDANTITLEDADGDVATYAFDTIGGMQEVDA